MRILIVEDDGGSRVILQEHLRARGWEVLGAERPERAQALLEREAVDLVLTDIHLPGASGTAHIRAFCGLGGPLVVVMTGFPSLETCMDSIAAGAAGYLVKPFKVDDFVALAERALEGRRRLARAGELERRVRELEEELARLRALPSVPGAAAPLRDLR
jgi:DNA-binding NtrC family response regulator